MNYALPLSTVAARAFKSLALASGLAAFALCSVAQAQTGEEIFERYFKDWYQVELVIFERIQAGSNDPESWPKNLTLRYPAQLTFLMSPEELKEQEAQRQQEKITAVLSAENSAENRRLLEQLKQGNTNDPYYQKLISSIEKSEVERLTPTEQPFVSLDPQIRTLNDEAKRIDRSRAMSVLFHGAWRQPVGDRKNKSAIVIQGGEQFGDHYELEGNISLFVSRYLHIHTNLWLSEFEANFGQDTEHWPILPPRPLPQSLDAMEEGINTDQDLNIDTVDVTKTTWDSPLDTTNQLSFRDQDSTDFLGNYSDLAQKPYVLKNLVTMRQKRRMRSSELHYIDHPKLGIILRIDKYEPKFDDTSSTVESASTP